MNVHDLVFLAAARLHRQHPDQSGFKGSELLRKVYELGSLKPRESTVNAHIYGHCVANKAAGPGTYRILYRNPDGTFRLFRDGDDYHPDRWNGKVAPEAQALPPEYRDLLDWYWAKYNSRRPDAPPVDPFLELRGLGKDVWESLGGDRFIENLRSHWFGAEDGGDKTHPLRFPEIWRRIEQHAGQDFWTVRGHRFTYKLAPGGAVRIKRGSSWVNRALGRSQFEAAYARAPLTSTGQLQDLQGPAYLFAILSDPRIAP